MNDGKSCFHHPRRRAGGTVLRSVDAVMGIPRRDLRLKVSEKTSGEESGGFGRTSASRGKFAMLREPEGWRHHIGTSNGLTQYHEG